MYWKKIGVFFLFWRLSAWLCTSLFVGRQVGGNAIIQWKNRYWEKELYER
jgi:hypothetical protein